MTPEQTSVRAERIDDAVSLGLELVRAIWDDPLTPATKKIPRPISCNEKTVAAWCRGKYLIPLVIAYAAHGAHETVQ